MPHFFPWQCPYTDRPPPPPVQNLPASPRPPSSVPRYVPRHPAVPAIARAPPSRGPRHSSVAGVRSVPPPRDRVPPTPFRSATRAPYPPISTHDTTNRSRQPCATRVATCRHLRPATPRGSVLRPPPRESLHGASRHGCRRAIPLCTTISGVGRATTIRRPPPAHNATRWPPTTARRCTCARAPPAVRPLRGAHPPRRVAQPPHHNVDTPPNVPPGAPPFGNALGVSAWRAAPPGTTIRTPTAPPRASFRTAPPARYATGSPASQASPIDRGLRAPFCRRPTAATAQRPVPRSPCPAP